MNRHAILHIPESRYCFPISTDEVVIRLRTSRFDDELKVSLIYGMKYNFQEKQNCVELELRYTDSLYNYYEIHLKLDDVRMVYVFRLEEKGKTVYYSEDGITDGYNFNQAFYNCFQLPYINEVDVMPTVDWMRGTVFYQIFVDRFCLGNKDKDMSYINMKWGDKPTGKAHAGGDLRGIINKLDYLEKLGISGLYLTPIFESNTNHKYDIIDYKKIDPQFGTAKDLVELVEKAHAHGIRVILDAVFNHCDKDMAQFKDVREKGRESKYYDWFIIHGDKPDIKKRNYECFASCEGMPKMNTGNPEVQDFLIDIATYWIDAANIDGWRLDVADEVSHDFWRRFRKEVKARKTDAVIIGENWHDAYPSLMGDQQDSIMNYAYTKTCIDYFAKNTANAKETAEKLNSLLMRNTEQVNNMMLNLLDSHDTHRFFTETGCNKKRLEDAIALTMVMPGTPCIYYGDEIAIEGGYDPDSRRCFDWDESHWDKELWSNIQRLIALKKNEDALHYGDVSITAEDNLLLISRNTESESIILAMNLTEKDIKMHKNTDWKLLIGDANAVRSNGYSVWKKEKTR